jgi:outer membrane scaffolding protein for murein synthesis (MipA/OmpV family)
MRAVIHNFSPLIFTKDPNMRMQLSIALVLTVCTQSLLAQPAQGGLPLWEIGGVGLAAGQLAYPGSSETVSLALAVPYVIYRGEFFRLDRNSAGFRAIHSPGFELDIGFSGSLGSRASETVARRGMDDLGTLIEFGPRMRWNLSAEKEPGQWRIELPLRGVFDLSNSAAYRGMVLEPELKYSYRAKEGWTWGTSISAIGADQSMQSLFYSVTAAQATANRAAYQAQAGLMALRLSGSWSYPLFPDARLLVFGRIDSVQGAANQASPLVRQNSGASVGAVLGYTWKQSETRASD